MTVLIDDRVGSRHLQPLVPGSELVRLDAGDAAFAAHDGKLIGIEVKRVHDAVQCLYTGRLADYQIPRMAELYDVRYLVIEGVYRPDPESGVLQLWREFDSSKDVKCGQWYDVTTGRKRLMYSAFMAWLSSMAVLGGVSVWSSADANTTAAMLLAWYSWWQRDDHRSFDTMHMAEGTGATLSRPTMLRRMLALLPHVAWERSAKLAQKVGAVEFRRKDGRPMGTHDWYIKGEIAQKSAEDIVRACDGEAD